jgi:ribosomal protein S17E
MATKKKIERPNQTITTKISPIETELKSKIAGAITEVVNRIKAKHLS